eukprot:1155459-Pelagomonas_calceolata.AAC.3
MGQEHLSFWPSMAGLNERKVRKVIADRYGHLGSCSFAKTGSPDLALCLCGHVMRLREAFPKFSV